MNNKNGLIVHIAVIFILLTLIIWNSQINSSSDDRSEKPYSGEVIIWPPDEPYHEEHHGDTIPIPGGGADIPGTFRDYDFEVKANATKGVIICGNFSLTGAEDVDIKLFGAITDEDGNRRVVATSASANPTETILLTGTPNPNRIDDFDRGGVGTWTLRVYNYASPTLMVSYDLTIDIYYEGARYPAE